MAAASTSIEQLFLQALQADKAFTKKWIVSWDYQKILSRRNVKYESSIISDFFEFKGAAEIAKWMNWFSTDYPDYMQNDAIRALVAKSRTTDERLLQKLGLEYDWTNYDNRVGINNAHDFILPQAYPVPERNRIKAVLDFGAGYGRQANLWHDQPVAYIGMDAIINSYCLQNIYYKTLTDNVTEYIDNPAAFRFDAGKPGIYHLPTWRLDLIPDNSLDLVMCVQVLPELGPRLVRYLVTQFERILKPGGAWYIRDHAYTWKPTGNFDLEAYLPEHGFTLEYKAHIINDKDIHGVPRIWRKTNPDVVQSQKRTFKHELQQLIVDADTLTGGGLKKLTRKIRGKK